ncbi:hypothetical protein SAMN05443637_11225 [Pseudonocardia thermophila]|jgi:hypothetical protein|uniref:DUF983 domain-containing protein n=1 Tax=Pseudonocardia thermophila TaxID=1848 RepID=A0A1M6VBI9_PSETH|nr:hypothetical protein [Pseudonocardia thermophila]SHK78741.1 hypothetical protein SAMN05443637_11225 [Pseudonocardia thermophila]
MRAKTVIGVDSREWSVRRNIEWSLPAIGDDFEHDVDGGRGAAVMVLSGLFVFWLLVLLWFPEHVHVPWYLLVLGGGFLLFFPIRWLLRRPWTIVAETEGSYDLPAERWTGMVRGNTRAAEEMRIIVRRLRTQGTPGHIDSPLQPIS